MWRNNATIWATIKISNVKGALATYRANDAPYMKSNWSSNGAGSPLFKPSLLFMKEPKISPNRAPMDAAKPKMRKAVFWRIIDSTIPVYVPKNKPMAKPSNVFPSPKILFPSMNLAPMSNGVPCFKKTGVALATIAGKYSLNMSSIMVSIWYKLNYGPFY